MSSEQHVEVVGGGIAGMAAAIFFRRKGWSVQVHEQYDSINEVGAGLLLKPNSLRALESAGVLARLPHQPAEVAATVVRDRKGKVMSRREHSGRLMQVCPLRSELIGALRETASDLGVSIRTGSQIVSADPAGRITDANGSTYSADLVVGADGWRSKTRDSVGLGRKARSLHTGATRILVPLLPGDSPSTLETYWAGARRIGLTPVNPGLLYAFLSCPASDTEGRAMPIDGRSWADAFPGLPRDLIDRFESAEGTWHSYSYVNVRRWSKGRVAILGDAATALPPTLAQGAGLAIMNAAAIVTELDGASDQRSGLNAWEAKYRPVCDRTQRWSMLRLYGTTNRLVSRIDSLQRLVLSATRTRLLQRRMDIADRVQVGREGPVPAT